MNFRQHLVSVFQFFSASVLALSSVSAQTQLFNPTPKNCCECVDISIANQKVPTGAGDSLPVAVDDGKGGYTLREFKVAVRDIAPPPGAASPCGTVLITSIKLVPLSFIGPAQAVEVYSGAGIKKFPTSGNTIDVSIPGGNNLSREQNLWYVSVTCSGNTQTEENESPLGGSCNRFFELGKAGCCACGGGDSPTGMASVSGGAGFSYGLPLDGSEAGDLHGTLSFLSPDSSNPGPSGLAAYVPASYAITRNSSGVITSITTPNSYIKVSPLSGLPDPNAFTIEQKRDSSSAPFRITTISLVDGTLKADSKLMSGSTVLSAFRHCQTKNGATSTVQSGPLNGSSFSPDRVETITTSTGNNGTCLTETHHVTVTENSTTISDTESTYTQYPWGWEKTKEIIDPGGEGLTSNWSYYGYNETTGLPGQGDTAGYGHLKSHDRYDGYQEIHYYWNNNHWTKLSFLNDPVGLTVKNVWNPNDSSQCVTHTVNEEVLSKEITTYDNQTFSTTTETEASDTQSLITTTVLMPYDQEFGGQPQSVTHPDGTITTYSYVRHADGGKTVIAKTGTAAKGRQVTTTYNHFGTVILKLEETYGYTPHVVLDHAAVTSVDEFGRALVTAHFPTAATAAGAVQASATSPKWTTSLTYSCCGVKSSVDQHGIATSYDYDGLRRLTKSTSLGVATETVRNGLASETHRYPAGGSASPASLISSTTRNLAGTSTTTMSPDPSSSSDGACTSATTTTSHSGGLTTTVRTIPGSGSQTTVSYPDGRTRNTTGDLAPSMEYAYAVNATGLITASGYIVGSAIKEISATQSDRAGRTTATGRLAPQTAPDTLANALSATLFDATSCNYNSIGQLKSITDADGVRTLSRLFYL